MAERGGGGGTGEEQDEQRGGGEKRRPGRGEWVVGIACALVVLAAVGYLFYQALTGPSIPPAITVRVERVTALKRGYLVEIRAVNEGSSTASSLTVEGALMRDPVAVEKSTATLDFVPAHAERGGGLYFTKNPRAYRLEVRPMGFDRP